MDHRRLTADDVAGIEALYGEGRPVRLASAVIFDVRQHFGDEPASLPGAWAASANDYTFDLPLVDVKKPAYLLFQARSVGREDNVLTVNGQPIAGGIPVTSGAEGWAAQVMLISPHVLKSGGNVLHVEATGDDAGIAIVDRDDFVLDNAVVLYTTIQPGLFLKPPRWPGVGFDIIPPVLPNLPGEA